VTGSRLDDRSSSPGRVKNFLLSTLSIPALRPTQPPIQWVPWALSPGSKAAGGPAVAQTVSHWIPTAAAHVHVGAPCGFCGQSGTGGRFSPSTSVSSATNFSNFSIIIITRGWHNMPISGRSADWTQLDSTPHYTK
jgi:hypothetical protein